jgi:hypothetical protein
MLSLLSLAHLLNNNVRIRITQEHSFPPLEREGAMEIFVLEPTENMKQKLVKIDGNRTLMPITKAVSRWEDKKEVSGMNGR